VEPVLQRLVADAVVVLHLAFVVFVIAGGFLSWCFPRVVWICPLTPLENRLRISAGDAGYEGGFVEHYIVPIIYPPGLTHSSQIGLGGLVILLNMVAYAVYFRRRHDRRNT
jgi:hypothetical protein